MGDNSPATRCNSFQFILLRFQSTCFRFKFRIPRFLSKRRLYRQANSTVIGPAHGIGKPGGDIADMSAHALRSGDSIGSRSRCRRTGCPRLGVLLGFQISRISICSAMGHRSSIGASKAGSFGRRALNRWPPSIPILMQASPIVSANGVFDFPLSSPHYFIILNRDSCVLNRRNVRGLGVKFQIRPSGNQALFELTQHDPSMVGTT